jgi:transmembrane sensor
MSRYDGSTRDPKPAPDGHMGLNRGNVFSLRMTDSPRPPASSNPSDSPTDPAGAPDWELIGRHLDGSLNRDEQTSIDRWLATHPHDAALIRSLDDRLSRFAATERAPVDVESALLTAKARLATSSRPALTVERGGGSGRPNRWIGAVTGLAAAAALGVVVLKPSGKSPAAPTVAAQRIESGVGRRDSVRLPDGTRVILAPGSRLDVAQGYGVTTRDVSIEGEGWFDVVHDDARPFTVQARGTTVRDIGTQFTVQAVPETPVRVVVTQGAVAVRATERSDEVRLNAGDVASIPAAGTPSVSRATATAADTAWLQGRLIFRESPMPEVTAALGRWYGITVVVGDSTIARRHLTATFADEPRSRVLSMLTLALGASVEQRGDTAILRAER